jgi:hypothetical protein
MTTAEIAGIFDARRVSDRFAAHCPGPVHTNNDRDPSLSITAGSDGSTLIHCHTGCRPEDVLQAVGLKMRDLFAGPPPTAEQARKVAKERMRRDAARAAMRRKRVALSDLALKLASVVDSLGAKLARTPPDASNGTALTRLFHDTLAKLRSVEAELETIHED